MGAGGRGGCLHWPIDYRQLYLWPFDTVAHFCCVLLRFFTEHFLFRLVTGCTTEHGVWHWLRTLLRYVPFNVPTVTALFRSIFPYCSVLFRMCYGVLTTAFTQCHFIIRVPQLLTWLLSSLIIKVCRLGIIIIYVIYVIYVITFMTYKDCTSSSVRSLPWPLGSTNVASMSYL